MEYITLALAKGRTAADAITLLKRADIHFPDFYDKSRKLVFYDTSKRIKLIFVKAVDVPTYVETGAADIGVAGKDNILESQADLYELLDLGFGKCKFAVAGFSGQQMEAAAPLTVASKYPSVAEQFFKRKGVPVEIIKLNGSVELAPLIGMADVIVDIVETGNTLYENGLTVLEEMDPISTRLIVNKASFATKTKAIQQIIKKLEAALE